MFIIDRAFDREVADYLAKKILTDGKFVPSSIQLDYNKGSESPASVDSFRTSSELKDGYMLPHYYERNVALKIQHAADYFRLSSIFQETARWNVIKYEAGEHFKLHTDCWDNIQGEGSDQRVLTALIVLQQAEDGGKTVMPNLGLEARLPPGMMMVWKNVDHGRCNPLLLHAGTPPKNGTKLVMTRWFRGGL